MANDLRLQVMLNAIDKATAPLRQISQGSLETARALKSARDRLKELNTQQKDVSAWRELQAANRETAASLEASNAKLGELSRATAKVRQQLAPTQALVEQSRQKFDALKDTQGELKRELTGSRDALGAVRDEYNKARSQIAALNAVTSQGNALTDKQRVEYEQLTTAQRARKVDLDQLAAKEKTLSERYTTGNTQLRSARAGHASLREELRRLEQPHKAQLALLRQQTGESKRLGEQYGQQKAKLASLAAQLKEAGINTNALGAHELKLKSQIDAANTSIATQSKRLAAMSAQQARAAKLRASFGRNREMVGVTATAGASAVATGAAAGLPILAMVKNYSSFEDAMAGVAKQVEGAREDNGKLTQTYYDMGAAIKKMGESIPMATTDIAALVEGGARMGIQGKDNLLEFARVAGTAATAFELPADQVGESLARIAQLYKLPIKNVSQLGDAINYLDDNAMSKGSDIIDVMQRTAGITASVGMSFKDAAALGSTFLTLGASAEVAGTATNAMIRELAIATQQPKRFQKGLAAVGLEAKAVQAGMVKDATGTIQKVLDAVSKLPQADQLGVMTELFGKEYGDDAAKLAANIGEYRRQLELVNSTKGSGSMQREGDIRGEALSARWQMTQNRMFNLSSALGETLRPTLIELVGGFNRIIERVNTWATQNPTLVASLLKVAAGIAALSAGFGVIALGIAGVLGPFLAVRFALSMVGLKIPTLLGLLRVLAVAFSGGLVTAIRAVSIALWGLAANPVALAIAAVVAVLAGAGYLIYQNWDQVKLYFANAWTEIKAGFSGGIGGILTTLANFSPIGLIYQAFAGVLSYLGVDLPTRFTEFGNMIVNGLVNGLMAGAGQIKEAITSIGGSTIDWFKEKLGIHSPSRVFAELGGFTMAGLTQGLQSGEQGPLDAVAQISKQLTSAGAFVMNAIAGPSSIGEQRSPAEAAGVAQPLKTAQAVAQPVASETTGAGSDVLQALASFGKQLTAAGASVMNAIIGTSATGEQRSTLEVAKVAQPVRAAQAVVPPAASETSDSELDALGVLASLGKQLTAAGASFMNAIVSPSITGEQRSPIEAAGVAQPLKAAQAIVPGPVQAGIDTGVLATLATLGKQVTAAGAMALGSIAAPVMAMGTAATPAIEIDNRSPVAPPTASTYDSHDHYEINIHPTPGMDAQAIARAVRAELTRIDREKSARKRSQLSDQE
ncbi:phage tail tape measure protein [Pseudomonas sp. BC115LW]|uniref:phage tail tape measure protein n=1 Tax=Pseudomonas sp. BC115LW TaxID=2683267 RepID=UPI0021146DC0|nr:phage tail tape measure protein [Pseudomonas sp. BC115LW]